MRAIPNARLACLAMASLWIATCRGEDERRVISLTPAGSDLVFELGAAALLIGVDAVSHQDARFAALPVFALDAALRGDADLLIGPAGSATARLLAALAPREKPLPELIELDPHSFEEAFSAAAAIGAALGREAAAERWARELRRELAKISASSLNQPRPRIAVLLALDPPVLAGGHSFLTELVEIAGAENLTHGTQEQTIAIDLPALAQAAPDLVLLVQTAPLLAERGRTSSALRLGGLSFETWEIDATRFWLREALPAARALRARVEALARTR